MGTKPKTEELEFKYNLHFINPYDFMRYFIGILNSFAQYDQSQSE